MTLQEFKNQRAALVAKLACLAIEINEQGKYYANCNITGHVNWVDVCIYKHVMEDGQCVDRKCFYDRMHQPYSNMKNTKLYFNESEDQYDLIIADLQNSYNEMLKYLE